MTRLAVPALFFVGLALAGCTPPATSSDTASTAAPKRGYEEPNTGSMFGGGSGDDSNTTGLNNSGVQGVPNAGSGGH